MAIDVATFRELRALDLASGGGLLDELVELFEKGTPERLARARAALAKRDGEALASEAHALKGSAGALGLSDLLALAGALEQQARDAGLAGAAGTLDALERAVPASLDELRAEARKP